MWNNEQGFYFTRLSDDIYDFDHVDWTWFQEHILGYIYLIKVFGTWRDRFIVKSTAVLIEDSGL